MVVEPLQGAWPGVGRGICVVARALVAEEAVLGVGVADQLGIDCGLVERRSQRLDVVDRYRLVAVAEQTEPWRLQVRGPVDQAGLSGKTRRDDASAVEPHCGSERARQRDEERDPAAHAESDDADAVVGEAFVAQMRERGMVSEQNRVEWIESIAGIKRTRKLFEIKYRIDAQSGLDYPGIVATGAGDFTVSRMKLDMLLLHENDLLDFLADLQAARKGYVSVRQCTVTRIDREAPPAPTALQPRLRAECKVDLVAVRGMKPA